MPLIVCFLAYNKIKKDEKTMKKSKSEVIKKFKSNDYEIMALL